MTSARKFAVIMNPAAGGGTAGKRYAKCAALLSRAGCAWDLHETTRPGHARRLARDLVSQSTATVLVAAGGDGTVNEVASGILDNEASTSLGILPLGTGNDFGRMHGANSIERAVEILARGRPRSVDAIRFQSRIDGRPRTSFALLFVSSGFVGNLLKATTPSVKRIFGRRFSYPVGFLKAWLSFAARSMQLAHDSGSHAGECLLVAACNSEYAGGHGFRPAPGAIMDDGKLELVIVSSQGRWKMLPQFIRVTRGTHVGLPGVHYVKITRMKLESAAGAGVQADGDLFGEPPLELEVKHRALNVLWDSPAG